MADDGKAKGDPKAEPKLSTAELLAKRSSAASLLAKTRESRAKAGEAGGAAPRRTLSSLTKSGALSKLQGASSRTLSVDAFGSGVGGMGSEKAAIILDIGAAYTKCGFSNEATPRVVIRSVTSYNGAEVRVYDPEEQRNISVMTEILVRFLHEVFYKHLLVKTTDRRVVFVEPIAPPVRFRQTIIDLLYRHYLVSSILHVPAATVATVPLWLTTALVVDCGHTETTVVAVFDGVPSVTSFTAVAAGAAEVHAQIKTRLADKWADPPDEALEDIKVRACIAGRLPEGTVLPTLKYSAKELQHGVDLDSELRTTACDSLFEGVNNDVWSSIPRAILDALMSCSVDSRKRLAKNIVLCGGTAMLPGFRHRLAQSIALLGEDPDYKALVGASSRRCVAKVTLAPAEVGKLEVGDLRGNAHRLLDVLVDLLRSGGVQVSESDFTVVDGKVVCTIQSPDEDIDEGLIRKDKASVLVGRRTYTITDITKSTTNTPSGVLDAVAFVESPAPANVLPWVGASILGTLESLASKSISRDTYLKEPSGGPDYTSNCLIRLGPKTEEPKPPPPEKWKVRHGRPSAWGCGSLAVPPEIKQHAI